MFFPPRLVRNFLNQGNVALIGFIGASLAHPSLQVFSETASFFVFCFNLDPQ